MKARGRIAALTAGLAAIAAPLALGLPATAAGRDDPTPEHGHHGHHGHHGQHEAGDDHGHHHGGHGGHGGDDRSR